MNIKYISWNYGHTGGKYGHTLHLIRLVGGRGLLKTSAQMVKLGLAKHGNSRR